MSDFTLRPFSFADVVPFCEIAQEVSIQKFMSDRFPTTPEQVRQFLTKAIYCNPKEAIYYAISVNHRFAGAINLKKGVGNTAPTAFLGYWLGEDFRNKGIMKKAIAKIIFEGLLKLEIERIQADVFDGNLPSMKLLKRSGFQLEFIRKKAIFKHNQLLDLYTFAMLKEAITNL